VSRSRPGEDAGRKAAQGGCATGNPSHADAPCLCSRAALLTSWQPGALTCQAGTQLAGLPENTYPALVRKQSWLVRASRSPHLPGQGGRTGSSVSKPDHSPPGPILLVTVGYFFPKKHVKIILCEMSQSETVLTHRNLWVLYYSASTSLHFLWWQRPQRLKSTNKPLRYFDNFQRKTLFLFYPLLSGSVYKSAGLTLGVHFQ